MRAVVTGASSGIGKHLTYELSSRGHTVVAVARRGWLMEALYHGTPNVVVYPADVSDYDQVKRLFSFVQERMGKIDAVIANAGVGYFGPFEETPLNDLEEMVRTNVLGTLYTVREALRVLDEKGKIVVVVSTAALSGKKAEAVYAMTKWAQRGFVESLRAEFAHRGKSYRVIGVYPGAVDTEFWDRFPHKKGSFVNPIHPERLARIIADAVESEEYVADITVNGR